MSFQFLSFEPDTDGLALITIRRPEKLNALNQALIFELGEAFRMAREDTSIKGLILTGAGEKAFVAGADIAELAKVDAIEQAGFVGDTQQGTPNLFYITRSKLGSRL